MNNNELIEKMSLEAWEFAIDAGEKVYDRIYILFSGAYPQGLTLGGNYYGTINWIFISNVFMYISPLED